MALIVFAGPSIGSPDPAFKQRISFRPPAQCGDITRAVVAECPSAIGLVDGVFETALAVWHKEILYALSTGVAVFGAASMGALRAAELEPFGMIGIGKVFRDYRDGRLEDDDEVALLHAPAELAFMPLTEAMVNVRATLDAAVSAGVLTAQDADVLRGTGKLLFYKERTWENIEARAAEAGLGSATLNRFTGWRQGNTIDVKKRDALDLLNAMLEQQPVPRDVPDLLLSRTKYWVRHEARFGAARRAAPVRRRGR